MMQVTARMRNVQESYERQATWNEEPTDINCCKWFTDWQLCKGRVGYFSSHNNHGKGAAFNIQSYVPVHTPMPG